MAEIRKHAQGVDNPIDRALLEALGEGIRPVQPGSRPAAAAAPTQTPRTVTPSDLTVSLGEGSWMQLSGRALQTFGTQPVQEPETEAE